MDLRRVGAFIAVAEESSIRNAAQRLHMSEPSLTRRIRQLEEELGLRLFVRNRHGMKLTAAGQVLLGNARIVASALADFLETARQTTSECNSEMGVRHQPWQVRPQ
jgi:DNA-binding transcriptional LysR family regulator